MDTFFLKKTSQGLSHISKNSKAKNQKIKIKKSNSKKKEQHQQHQHHHHHHHQHKHTQYSKIHQLTNDLNCLETNRI